MKFRKSREEEIAHLLVKLREKYRAYIDTNIFDLRWSAIGDDGNYIFLDGHEDRVREIAELSKEIISCMESIKRLRAELYEKDGEPDERPNDIKGQEDCGGEYGPRNEENNGAAEE